MFHGRTDLEKRGLAGLAQQQSFQLGSSLGSICLGLQLLHDALGSADADALLPGLLNAALQRLNAQRPLCPEGFMISNGGACTQKGIGMLYCTVRQMCMAMLTHCTGRPADHGTYAWSNLKDLLKQCETCEENEFCSFECNEVSKSMHGTQR